MMLEKDEGFWCFTTHAHTCTHAHTWLTPRFLSLRQLCQSSQDPGISLIPFVLPELQCVLPTGASRCLQPSSDVGAPSAASTSESGRHGHDWHPSPRSTQPLPGSTPEATTCFSKPSLFALRPQVNDCLVNFHHYH